MIFAVFRQIEILDVDLFHRAGCREFDRVERLIGKHALEMLALAFGIVNRRKLQIDGRIFDRAVNRAFEIRQAADHLRLRLRISDRQHRRVF